MQKGKILTPVLALALALASGCSSTLKPASAGPDPAGGQPGALKTIFVNPPYRATDTVNITGQTPLPKSSRSARR